MSEVVEKATRRAPHRWRVLTSEEGRLERRLTGDWIRVATAAFLLALSALHVGDEGATEQDAQRLLTGLPDGLRGFFDAIERLGALWAVLLLVIVLVVAKRWRLGLVLGLAGVGAWAIGRFMGFVVGGASFSSAIDKIFDGADIAYPVVPLGVLAAVLITASPYLVRPARRTGQVVLALMTLGVVYGGDATLNAAFAALVLGWGIAAVLHLAFGSPAGWPSVGEIATALDELGVDAASVRLLPTQPTGCSLMEAVRRDGTRLSLRVYGRDASDTQLVAKTWRFLMYKDSGQTLTTSRLQQVEHEALCLVAARAAGVDVPDVVAVGVSSSRDAILATSATEGVPVSEETGAAYVDGAWEELRKLRAARLAHGALDADHVLESSGALQLFDFSVASISAPQPRLDRDVAQLLVTTALVVGASRAVEAAGTALGDDVLAAALPLIQRPAMTRATRAALRHNKHLLDELHAAITDRTGTEVVEPVELRRVKPLTVLMIVGLLFALWVILGQVGSISNLLDTLGDADWAWVAVVAVLTQSTNLSYAIATVGSVDTKVPFGPAVVMQYAIAFTNLVAPSGVASGLMNIRFLQKQGAPVAVATSSGVLIGLSGTIASFALFAMTALVVGQQASLSEVGQDGDGQLFLIIAVVVSVLLGVVAVIPALRKTARAKWWPPIANGFRNIWSVLSSPRKLAMVLGGAVGAQLLYSLSLGAALAAYGAGGELSFAQLVFVNTSASFLASLTPVPGGMGVTEAALISGLTAFGVAGDVASAAVITHRLFTTYLPPIPGSYATKWLISEGNL